MSSKSFITRALAAGVLFTCAAAAHAVSYFRWEMVELPASSGATCGNGSPYRFFINRTPFTTKTVVSFEGGGACWGQNNCLGKGGLLSAFNPNGIPTNYMSGGLPSLGTPMVSRINPLQGVQTQSWNLVYMPYCTGDVHVGNAINVYSDADPANPLVYAHKGAVNAEAVAAWLKANVSKPNKLLVVGFSAGGVGATANYNIVRNALNPKTSGLLADSGPLFPAPRNADPALYPSVLLQNKIRQVWGLDGPNGLVTKTVAALPGLVDPNDLGTLSSGLAKFFPNDRFGYTLFRRDGIFTNFSYTPFYPDVAAAKGDAQRALWFAKWDVDVSNWKAAMEPLSNVGYYIPYQRDLLASHVTTALLFNGTSIKEANQANVGAFIDNIIGGTGTPTRAFQTQQVVQQGLGPIFSPIYNAVASMLGL